MKESLQLKIKEIVSSLSLKLQIVFMYINNESSLFV